ncbi:MAG TPA: hypothetical protein VL500_08075 [Candidatus Eisenbacteria bacterium]|nr:hypothetical protein [Candidatus Eisenbacteria bacterium]
MEERSLPARFADGVIRIVLVLFGLVCTPIPSVLWFVLVDDTASGYSYNDDGPWLSSLVIFLIAVVAYAMLVVPAIWRRRFVGAGRPSAA